MEFATRRGSAVPQAKLTEAQAQAILNLKHSGRRIPDVAEEFGIHQTVVGAIWRRKSWRHLTPPPNPDTEA